ncbi:bifunctional alpha/beta hydrolase/OsmC family protein [Marivirga harenae]|uniref:bifunctional alpha/beta hydrolase/OsmC family protein n=1 Tax=Marivirga harenae TaxID=2010992 RepID=UPI0026E01626|nr:bifunctional alpha/beta hydrolase/OsmC family protein [Marivirga harenae]WKV13859.1 bifunctional alpha/beta hydrolase/OsmC family protein [Marivirga harenae]|tara:strand:- start:164465 stop:165679 length:1215 start_codon:yes stop_codon:yes gene_type:complete
MKKENIQFEGSTGDKLSAAIHFPADDQPHNYVIFAHCFTCNKNLNAVRNIILSMTKKGFAVLSFDFTGLGQSEGEFSDTNFSSNIDDLIKASNYLKENYREASLLIGHSLGGAAVLMAADLIDSVAAIATIGAPAEADHVLNLIEDKKEEILKKGEAKVNIGGRPFKIKKQFLDDLQSKDNLKKIKDLRKALLILHSPQDQTVDISNAATLYEKAHHPKSFISLDGADHLLSNKEDSLYAGEVIATWADRYIEKPKQQKISTDSQTVAFIGKKEDQYTTQIVAEGHHLIADEPEDVGGNNFGTSPYGLLTSALAACTAITLRMYANRKNWDVDEILVHVDQDQRYDEDSQDCESDNSKITFFDRSIEIKGSLDEKQRKRLIEIANKCPVHKTLESKIKVETKER